MTEEKAFLRTLPDLLIKTAIVFAAVFICSGYVSMIYLPELSMVCVAAVSALAAIAFSLPAALGFSIAWGWLASAVGFAVMFFADKQAFYYIPQTLVLKAECISEEIFEFRPDYLLYHSFDCSFDGLAPYIILLAALDVLLAFAFVRCFFKNKCYFAVCLTVLCFAVSFLGYEKANPVFMIFSVMLLCLIWAFDTGFAKERGGNIRLAALTLALIIIAGVFSAFYVTIGDKADDLANELKLDKLKAYLTGEAADVPIYLPAEAGGDYASVKMSNVKFADKPVYYAYIPGYIGNVYLYSTSYYDFSGLGWENSTNYMEFVSNSQLIVHSGPARLIRANGVESIDMPRFIWSDGRIPGTYDAEGGMKLPGYTTNVYLPMSPSDSGYIFSLARAAYMNFHPIQQSRFSQYYESDVDFAAIARSLLEEAGIDLSEWYNPYYSPSRSEVEDAIREVGIFLSHMTYTTSPTASEKYDEYDKSRSPMYNFIYITNEGYCVHFATAAALILREMGFITRYTIGYSFNEGVGMFEEVLDSNSHAWAEIYFDSVGWIPLEMTRGSGSLNPDPDESGFETSEASSEYEESQWESSSISEESSTSVESDSSEELILSREASEIEESVPDLSDSGSSDYSEDELPPKMDDEFPTIGVVCCLVLLAVAVTAVVITRSILKKCEERRRKFENSCYADGAEAVKAVKADWRFVLGIFELLGEKTSGDIMAYASYIDEKYPDMPQLTPMLISFLAAEFGEIASATDAKVCGKYALSLNDWAVKRLKLTVKIRAYISGRLLRSGKHKE